MWIRSCVVALGVSLAAAGCELKESPPAGEPAVALPDAPWRVLADAESAFAGRAQEIGISPAFLEVLDERGVIFSTGPVPGRRFHTETPFAADTYLRWHPRIASVSRAGDLGYTSGPWVAGQEGQPAGASGHYLSVWSRRPDGGWSLLVDIGVSHAPLADQEVARPATEFPSPEAAAPTWTEAEAEHGLTLQRSQLWTALRATTDSLLAQVALPDVRVYANGRLPGDGPASLAELVSQVRTSNQMGSGMSSSRDLAYVYGTTARPGALVGSFLEIWTARGSDWKLAVILLQES